MCTNPSRTNRTIVVDFRDEGTYHRLCQDGRAFVEFIVAFLLHIGFQLRHKPDCCGGFRLTRHSHYVRVRIGDLVIWRIQCTQCKAVFTVLPHFVLRYRKMKPEVAKKAALATYGGLSLELCSVVCDVSAMALYRLICAFGKASLVTLLTRCHLPLPRYLLADEKHSSCLTEKVYLPTLVSGRVVWHLGYTTDKSAEAFEASYRLFQQQGEQLDPSWQVEGVLTDGVESTRKSLRHVFPKAEIGNCLLHAAKKLPAKLKAISQELRYTLSREFYLLCQTRHQMQTSMLNPLASLAQALRRFSEKVTQLTGQDNGQTIRTWITQKKAGWYALIHNPNIPTTSTLLDQVHNTLERKLFMMKAFHHPEGNQQHFLNGLALLVNLIPYQRRAKHAGLCAIQVEGGTLPTNDWFLNLQILTAGGFL